MGGTKKPTLSKLRKMTMKKEKAAKKGEEKRREVYKGFLTPKDEEELSKYILRQKYITPSMLSRKGEIRISIARRLLRKLYSEGMLTLVEKHKDVEVYAPASA